MTLIEKWIAYKALVGKEVRRIFRIWRQTILPPIITSVLYFLIFGHVIGHRVGTMSGVPYIQFIAPGLIMMQVIMGAYTGSVGSFFIAKFSKSIEELLVSPMSNSLILISYISVGILRGLITGVLVTTVAIFFTHLHVYSLFSILIIAIISSAIFSLGGLINAIVAKTFDDTSLIPTFVLTPLTYLGGVFYSITLLPDFWRYVSMADPILYIVSLFRYGFLGITDNHIVGSYLAVLAILVVMFSLALYMMSNAKTLRS